MQSRASHTYFTTTVCCFFASSYVLHVVSKRYATILRGLSGVLVRLSPRSSASFSATFLAYDDDGHATPGMAIIR